MMRQGAEHIEDAVRELAELLRHGGSAVRVDGPAAGMPPAVWIECEPLWVEVWLEKRLRISSILYGDEAVRDFVRGLPAGVYTGPELERAYMTREEAQ